MNKDEIIKLGQRIKKVRLALKMTQAELAKHCGITESTMINYEVARRTPGVEFLITLVKDFRVNPYWLLTGWGEFSFMKSHKFLLPFEVSEELRDLLTYIQVPVVKHSVLAHFEESRIRYKDQIRIWERDFFMT